jgi:hypothetical protein
LAPNVKVITTSVNKVRVPFVLSEPGNVGDRIFQA